MKNFLFQGGGKGFQSRLILLGPIPYGAAIKMARKVIDRKIATLASLMRVGSEVGLRSCGTSETKLRLSKL